MKLDDVDIDDLLSEIKRRRTKTGKEEYRDEHKKKEKDGSLKKAVRRRRDALKRASKE